MKFLTQLFARVFTGFTTRLVAGPWLRQAQRLVISGMLICSANALADEPFQEYMGAWRSAGHWTTDINAAGAEAVAIRNAECLSEGPCDPRDVCTFTVVDGALARGNCVLSGAGVGVANIFRRTSCPDGSSRIGAICAPGDPKNAGAPRCDVSTGNPINAGTGNKYQEEADLVDIPGFPQGVSHFVNSQVANTFGWSFNWEVYRVSSEGVPPTVVTLRRPGNKQYRYTLQGGMWTSDTDVTGMLERLVNASNNTTGWRYTTADGDVEIYKLGVIESITNRQGLKWTYAWSGSNFTVTNSFGRTLIFGTDAQNNRTMNVFGGGVFTYRNDANNNLASITYPDGKVRTYLYEDSRFPNALTGIIDENGVRYATWAYDAQGRAISSEHAGGVDKVTLAYGANTTVITDARGSVRTNNLSTVLGVVRSTGSSQPGGSGCGPASSAISYDANGNVASRSDFSGGTTTYSYDTVRNLEIQRVEAGSQPEARTFSTQWHSIWPLPAKVAGPNRLTRFVYNGDIDNGQVLACAPAGAVIPAAGGNQPIGVLCKQTEQATTDASGSQGFTAPLDTGVASRSLSWTYNAAGQVLTSTDSTGGITGYSYYDDTSLPGNVPADPNMASVSLLLHGDGSHGSTAVVDSSLNPKIFTVAGGASLSTTQSKFGGSSLYFDGVDASNTAIAVADSPDFHFPGAYTIEFWVRPSSFKPINTWLYLQSDQVGKPAPIRLEIAPSTGLINVLGSSDNTNWLFASGLSSTSALQLGTWSHIALADDGITARLFVNGVLQASRATWSKTDSPDPLRIGGAYTGGDREFDGYMDDVRITKGVARYTAAFTPPVQAFPNSAIAAVNPNAVGHSVGDLKSITNAAGHVTRFTLYDAAGRVRQVIDPKGVVTGTAYTPRGWTSSVTVTPPGGTARTTTYTYDNAGQLTGAALPDGTTMSYSYDAAHRLTGVTDAKGNSVTYTLDNAGNKTGEQVKDPSGNLQRNITRVYDALNRVQQVTGASN
ncbi:LamG-like jellyroll fold domain-containing protein [Polaromonas sp. YR568]|uniref:LamG-like jellyroll fold domain-containing protein n=1 Tax=Polaromonas sp. YR568 TaxID=1855301 RepID=UPI00398BD8D0